MNFGHIKKGISQFVEQSSIVSECYDIGRVRCFIDMVWCLVRYGAQPVDYSRFEFYKKSGRERNRYLTIFKYFTLSQKMRRQLPIHISGDKIYEYITYKKFVKREWMAIENSTSDEAIIAFINKYHTVIAKPNNGEQGKGVIKISEYDKRAIKTLFEQRKHTLFVMEEMLKNEASIEAINESSLNTLRCYTFIDKKGKIHILEMMLRVGQIGSHVDNWGSGGIGYIFDTETGICSQYGQDKLNKLYIFHPGSNFQMIGYKLPHFEELRKYILEMCMIEPKARFVGWDIAITPNGFELIEMNCPGGHDFLQAFGTPWGDYLKKNW